MSRRTDGGRTRLFVGSEPKSMSKPSSPKVAILRYRVLSEDPVCVARSETAQQLAGHADPPTTARYDGRGEGAKRRAAGHPHVPYSGD